MKWIFYLMVAIYVLFRTVYGENVTIFRDEDNDIWSVGEKREIVCIGTQKNQKLRWKTPNGVEVDRRRPGNTRIYSQDRSARGSMPTLALLFNRVSAEDSGLWSCHAGELTSFTSVCVMDTAVFVTTETEVNIDAGRAITLTCEARGKPEPLVLWYRDGNLITDEYVKGESSKYKLMTKYNVHSQESLLTVSSLEASDSGVYVCAAVQNTELCEFNQTLSFTLNLNSPPVISSSSLSETTYVNYDENVTLLCYAEGYPTPEITWYQQRPDRVVKIDSSENLTIVTEENKSELQFLVDNRTINESFLCIATNKYGESERLFKLAPVIAPVAPDKITLVNETDTELTLEVNWNAYGHGRLLPFPVVGLKVQYMKTSQLVGGKSWRPSDWNRAKILTLEDDDLSVDSEGILFTLHGLSPDTTYLVRVRIYNGEGYSNWSKQFKYSTAAFPSTTEEYQIVDKDEMTEDMKKDNIVTVTEEEVLPGTTDRMAISDGTEDSSVQPDSNNLYAMIFGVGIFVVIGGCMFIMKKM